MARGVLHTLLCINSFNSLHAGIFKDSDLGLVYTLSRSILSFMMKGCGQGMLKRKTYRPVSVDVTGLISGCVSCLKMNCSLRVYIR